MPITMGHHLHQMEAAQPQQGPDDGVKGDLDAERPIDAVDPGRVGSEQCRANEPGHCIRRPAEPDEEQHRRGDRRANPDCRRQPCRNAGGKGPHLVVEHHEDCGEKSKYVDAAKCGFLLSHAVIVGGRPRQNCMAICCIAQWPIGYRARCRCSDVFTGRFRVP